LIFWKLRVIIVNMFDFLYYFLLYLFQTILINKTTSFILDFCCFQVEISLATLYSLVQMQTEMNIGFFQFKNEIGDQLRNLQHTVKGILNNSVSSTGSVNLQNGQFSWFIWVNFFIVFAFIVEKCVLQYLLSVLISVLFFYVHKSAWFHVYILLFLLTLCVLMFGCHIRVYKYFPCALYFHSNV